MQRRGRRAGQPWALSLLLVVQLGAKSCVPAARTAPPPPRSAWPSPLVACLHPAGPCLRCRGGQSEAEQDGDVEETAGRMEASGSGEPDTEADGAQEAMAMDTDADGASDAQVRRAQRVRACVRERGGQGRW